MNLLITGAWQQAAQYITEIESLGHQVYFMQWEKDPLPCEPSWVEGIIGNGIFLQHPIEQFESLRYIQLTSAGLDRIPLDYIQTHNIALYAAKGVYSIPMAEYAAAGVLALYKQLPFFQKNQQAHRWEKSRTLLELSGKNVLIIGCGSVGQECAKRFSAFGCHITGLNRTVREIGSFDHIIALSHLMEVLPQADIVILSIALNKETKYLIGAEQLALMKSDAILVNISRGAVIDQSALIDTLEASSIGGAVLDVFEEEPLDESCKLWELGQVILTPHNSFVSDKNQNRLSKVIINNLQNKSNP